MLPQKAIWILKGFVLGVASLIPGLSAGTLAVILSIYEKIILSISELLTLKIKKENLIFLLLLSFGCLVAIFSLAKGMSYILTQFSLEVYSFFGGLILAALPRLFELTNKKTSSVLYIGGVALGVFALLYGLPEFSQLENYLFSFFISGFLGVFISVLPGISGSMILVILGTYHACLQALTRLEWTKIGLFILGGLIGLLSAFYFVRLIMRKNPNAAFCTLLGLILAGVTEILPWEAWHSLPVMQGFLRSILFILLGSVCIFLTEKIAFFKKRVLKKL